MGQMGMGNGQEKHHRRGVGVEELLVDVEDELVRSFGSFQGFDPREGEDGRDATTDGGGGVRGRTTTRNRPGGGRRGGRDIWGKETGRVTGLKR